MARQFDIVLVLAHFRSATAYLSVIRHLSPELRVAVLPARVDAAALQHTTRAQQVFLELCEKFGAEILQQGTRAATRLMIVQQFPYPAPTVAEIDASVVAQRRVALLGFATGGLEKHDTALAAFRLRKAYVPSTRFLQFLLRERQAQHRFHDIEVVEVGLPFIRYPVFPEFQADYIIAAPTVFSFRTEQGKHRFLQTTLKLLQEIPRCARIVYKSHNGNDLDYFAPKLHYALARVLRHVAGAESALSVLARISPARARRHIERIQTGLLHLAVLERAEPMSRATAYADMSLEAFLPGVRGGVIGGLSNTIWGTLYSGLPFYNCVDDKLREPTSDLLPNRSSDTLLDLNLRYFGVPYCAGELAHGARGTAIVTEQDRRGDLLREIRRDLDAA